MKKAGSIAVAALVATMSVTGAAGVAYAEDAQPGTGAGVQPGTAVTSGNEGTSKNKSAATPPVVSDGGTKRQTAAQPGTGASAATKPSQAKTPTNAAQPGTAATREGASETAAQPGTGASAATKPSQAKTPTNAAQPGTNANQATQLPDRKARPNTQGDVSTSVVAPQEPVETVSDTTTDTTAPKQPARPTGETPAETVSVTRETSTPAESDSTPAPQPATPAESDSTPAPQPATPAAPPAPAPAASAQPLGVAGAELAVEAPGVSVTAGGTSTPLAGDVAVHVGAGEQEWAFTTESGGIDVSTPVGNVGVSQQQVQSAQSLGDTAFSVLPQGVQNAANAANRAVLDQAASLPEVSAWDGGLVNATLTVTHW